MKTLKFAEPLPSLILNKEKNTTWRIEDEKYLSVNDVVSCLRKKDLSEFAKIKIISVKETTFEYLSFEDKRISIFRSPCYFYCFFRRYKRLWSSDLFSKRSPRIFAAY